MEYIVTRWPDSPASAIRQATITVTITATTYLGALALSGLKEPGALISVSSLVLNIRYRVDSCGYAIELAHYGGVD